MADETEIRIMAEEETDPRVDLAVERTELALERTHLAWIRTMFALITAGLAIDKGFAIIHQKRLESGDAWIKNAHVVGLSLIIFGTVLLLIESFQYIKRGRQLAVLKKAGFAFFSPGIILASLVILLGLVLTFLIIYFG